MAATLRTTPMRQAVKALLAVAFAAWGLGAHRTPAHNDAPVRKEKGTRGRMSFSEVTIGWAPRPSWL